MRRFRVRSLAGEELLISICEGWWGRTSVKVFTTKSQIPLRRWFYWMGTLNLAAPLMLFDMSRLLLYPSIRYIHHSNITRILHLHTYIHPWHQIITYKYISTCNVVTLLYLSAVKLTNCWTDIHMPEERGKRSVWSLICFPLSWQTLMLQINTYSRS